MAYNQKSARKQSFKSLSESSTNPRLKNTYYRYLSLVILLILSSFQSVWAQNSVRLVANMSIATDCGPNARTVTAFATGGSGSYRYYWNANPPANATIADAPTIPVDPSETTTVGVAVVDRTTGAFIGNAEVTVYPKVKGAFDTSFPTAFTPNGDGINDAWSVQSSNLGTAPLHANAYQLEIYSNRGGPAIYTSSGQDTRVSFGYNGGEIRWDGSGALTDGGYRFYLTLSNCDNSQQFTGNINIFALGARSASRTTSSESLAVYPNPVSDQLVIHPTQLLSKEGAAVSKENKSINAVGKYEITLLDKFSQVRKSVISQDSEVKFDVSGLPEGTYFLHVKQGKESTHKQIVIAH